MIKQTSAKVSKYQRPVVRWTPGAVCQNIRRACKILNDCSYICAIAVSTGLKSIDEDLDIWTPSAPLGTQQGTSSMNYIIDGTLYKLQGVFQELTYTTAGMTFFVKEITFIQKECIFRLLHCHKKNISNKCYSFELSIQTT